MYRDLGIGRIITRAGGAPDFAEKRRHPRRQLSVRCWVADGNSTVYARIHDVSLGGLCIHAPVPFSVHAELELSLVLSDTGDPNGSVTVVKARGRVVWVEARGGGRRLGAQFTHVVSGRGALTALVE